MITWRQDGFALADGYDRQANRDTGLALPSGDAHFGQITDSTRPPRARHRSCAGNRATARPHSLKGATSREGRCDLRRCGLA